MITLIGLVLIGLFVFSLSKLSAWRKNHEGMAVIDAGIEEGIDYVFWLMSTCTTGLLIILVGFYLKGWI